MANDGKYYIAVRVLLPPKYLVTNAGRNRVVKRRELEQLLEEHDMKVEKKTLHADFAVLEDVFVFSFGKYILIFFVKNPPKTQK